MSRQIHPPGHAPRSAGFPSRGETVTLDPSQIDGPFSLIDDRPLAITTVPGLVIRVHRGRARANTERGENTYLFAGERYVSDRLFGTLTLLDAARTEVRVDLP